MSQIRVKMIPIDWIYQRVGQIWPLRSERCFSSKKQSAHKADGTHAWTRPQELVQYSIPIHVAEHLRICSLWAEVNCEKKQLFDLRPDLPHSLICPVDWYHFHSNLRHQKCTKFNPAQPIVLLNLGIFNHAHKKKTKPFLSTPSKGSHPHYYRTTPNSIFWGAS